MRESAALPGLLHELPPEDWEAIFNTNLRGVYYMMRAVVPLMIAAGAGHIINISSLAGKNPLPRGAAYSASKWGLNGLSYGSCGRIAGAQHSRQCYLPRSVDTDFSPRRERQRHAENAEAGRCGPRGRHAGYSGAAVVHQRSADSANAETVARRTTVMAGALSSLAAVTPLRGATAYNRRFVFITF